MAEIILAMDTGPATSFSYLFPNIPGATPAVFAQGANAAGELAAAQVSGIALGTTNASLTLPTPTSAILPADQATSIGTATDFSWTAVTPGVTGLLPKPFGPEDLLAIVRQHCPAPNTDPTEH